MAKKTPNIDLHDPRRTMLAVKIYDSRLHLPVLSPAVPRPDAPFLAEATPFLRLATGRMRVGNNLNPLNPVRKERQTKGKNEKPSKIVLHTSDTFGVTSFLISLLSCHKNFLFSLWRAHWRLYSCAVYYRLIAGDCRNNDVFLSLIPFRSVGSC